LSGYGLVPFHGLASSPTIALPASGELLLGRDPGPTGVKVADPRCSRRHASVTVTERGHTVRDLGSKNGTFVNGERVQEAALKAGDHLRIGHAEFGFCAAGEPCRCACCMKTLITAPPEAPFCTECRRSFPLLGATLGERRLLRGLGNGSFGSVYVGHRPGNPYVAVKVLHVEFTESPDVVMKFLREAYATAGIEHENIVRFGDSGHESGHWYIILEYFPSVSLRQILDERGTVSEAELLPMARQILNALEYAHDQKLLHRDIKPGNILISTDGRVKMVDFGLAKRLVDSAFTSHTATGMPGTPLFMAPEVLQGSKKFTFRSDIYSLGATLFRALTGRHPIEARKLDEWMTALQTETPPRASSIRTGISPQLDDALQKALQKEPAKRHASMRTFRKALGLT
ncbi:MAG: protein kinase, partial [Planctomycetota bacterium]